MISSLAGHQWVDDTGTHGIGHSDIPYLADYLLSARWDQVVSYKPDFTLGGLIQERFLDARNLWRAQRFLLAEAPDAPLLDQAEDLFSRRSKFGMVLARAAWTTGVSESLRPELIHGLTLVRTISSA